MDNGIDPSFARSKSWDEFAAETAPNGSHVLFAQMPLVKPALSSRGIGVSTLGVDDPAAIISSDEEIRAGFANCLTR